MNKDDIWKMITVSISCLVLFIAGASTYAKLFSNDTVSTVNISNLELRVSHLENSVAQQQKELNTFRVQVSNVITEMHTMTDVIKDLTNLVRENIKVSSGLQVVVTKLEERQKNSDKILERLVSKMEDKDK